MVQVSGNAEDLARAALRHDALTLRSLVQELLRECPSLAEIAPPRTDDPQVLGTAAALIELIALRTAQSPPDWTKTVGRVPTPTYLVAAAATMKHLRTLCETESPEPLRKRGLYAPPDFLSFA